MRRDRGQVALERTLSKLGLASRTEARALIREGRVAVDGRVVTDPLAPVVPERIRVDIDGRPVVRTEPLTILLHKPRGVVTTRSDPEGRPTVYGCLEGLETHVVPVGRLDAATTGLLLLTNDTRFADWVTDPGNAVPRVYLVTVRGELDDATARPPGGGDRASGRPEGRGPQALRPRDPPGARADRRPEPRGPPPPRRRRPRGHPPQARLLRRSGAGGPPARDMAGGVPRRVAGGLPGSSGAGTPIPLAPVPVPR